jgi:hypothetical protein
LCQLNLVLLLALGKQGGDFALCGEGLLLSLLGELELLLQRLDLACPKQHAPQCP